MSECVTPPTHPFFFFFFTHAHSRALTHSLTHSLSHPAKWLLCDVDVGRFVRPSVRLSVCPVCLLVCWFVGLSIGWSVCRCRHGERRTANGERRSFVRSFVRWHYNHTDGVGAGMNKGSVEGVEFVEVFVRS